MIMQNIYQQKEESAISHLFHHETTAVPLQRASRFIFIALFYSHVMRPGMGLAFMELVPQKAQRSSLKMNAAERCTPQGKH